MNNLFHRDRKEYRRERERGGGERERERERVEKRVNFTTRKMRVYRLVARKG